MELDDLKKTWQQETNKQPNNQNIMELIHQKSKGPLSLLKRSFRRQMIAILVVLIAISLSNGKNADTVPGFVFFGTYVAFCLAVAVALYRNYRLSAKMETMDFDVKANLESYIKLLEKRLKWQSTGVKIVILVFILLLELMPLFYHARMLDKWHSVPVQIRIPVYAAYLVFVYFVRRRIMQRKYGQHLAHLKALLEELI